MPTLTVPVLHRPADDQGHHHIHLHQRQYHHLCISLHQKHLPRNHHRTGSIRNDRDTSSSSDNLSLGFLQSISLSPLPPSPFQDLDHDQDQEEDPAPIFDTDPEEISNLWDDVRNSSCNATLEFDFPLAAMAANQDPYTTFNLQRYGITLLNANHNDPIFAEIIHRLQNHSLRDSGVHAWQDMVADFGKSAKEAQTIIAKGQFLDFYDFVRTAIFRIPVGYSETLLRYTYGKGVFSVRNPNDHYYGPVPLQTRDPASSTQLPQSSSLPRPTSQIHSQSRSSRSYMQIINQSHTTPDLGRPLPLPLSHFDFAYMINTKNFAQEYLSSKVFLAKSLPFSEFQAALPYLSVAFDDELSMIPKTLEDKKPALQNRLAVYGSTALYNRFQLALQTLEEESQKNLSFLHFGITVIEEHIAIYVFKPKLSRKGAWPGCTFNTIYTTNISSAINFKSFLEKLDVIHRWAASVYLDGLQKDLTS